MSIAFATSSSLHSASGLRLQTVYGRGYRLVCVGPDGKEIEPSAAPSVDGGAANDAFQL